MTIEELNLLTLRRSFTHRMSKGYYERFILSCIYWDSLITIENNEGSKKCVHLVRNYSIESRFRQIEYANRTLQFTREKPYCTWRQAKHHEIKNARLRLHLWLSWKHLIFYIVTTQSFNQSKRRKVHDKSTFNQCKNLIVKREK